MKSVKVYKEKFLTVTIARQSSLEKGFGRPCFVDCAIINSSITKKGFIVCINHF